jgi:Putative Ig domain
MATCAGCIPVWNVSLPANVAGDSVDYLSSVSCATSSWCIAVGYTDAVPDGSIEPLIETYDGSAWAITSNPATDGAGGVLYSVSCASTTWCAAVGLSNPANPGDGHDATLVETFDGTGWTEVANTQPGLLTDVSCTSSTWCIAVGGTGGAEPLGTILPNEPDVLETYDGTKWTVGPDPAPGGVGITSLSCTSASWCMGMGDVVNNGVIEDENVFESYNGTDWELVPTPVESGNGAYMFSLSCSSPIYCVAVGAAGSTPEPALETFNGTAWVMTPSPSNSTDATLYGVSCAPDTTWCVAAGRLGLSGPDSSPTQTLLEESDSGDWSVASSPDPGSDSALYGASCATDAACVAVGSYSGGSLAVTGGDSTPPLEIATTSLPGATVGEPYTTTLSAVNGEAPYTWSLINGSLPPGLSLSPSGVVSGSPTGPGTSTFTVAVTEGGPLPFSAAEEQSISVVAGS